jgi:hypothetical protein
MSETKKKVPGSVIDIIRKGVSGNTREPVLAEIAQHFFDLAGGERNVAKMLFDQYRDPSCPSSVKTKIIHIMLGHLKWLNERTGTIDEMGNLTQEDLERELDKHIRAVAQAAVQRRAAAEQQEVAQNDAQRERQQSA